MVRSLFGPGQWPRLCSALRADAPILIGLDLDGTLAPIVRRPERARVPGRTLRLLGSAARSPRVRIAVVSARPMAALRRMVPVSGVHRIGQYGLEGPLAPAARTRSALRRSCARIGRRLTLATQEIPGVWVERKGLSVALHYRAVPPRRVPSLRRVLVPVVREARRASFRAVGGQHVTDFVPNGFDKGRALRALIERFRPVTTIYFGDSAGDEPAFRVLRRRDFPIRVGRGATRAPYRVGDLRGVTRVLAAVIRLRQAPREWR